MDNALPAKKTVPVLGHTMAYREMGEGPPILFLHGNPTSSYLWRNVMPHVAGLGRAIAPDLIGMGDSDKLPGEDPQRYRFVAHAAFLEAFIDAVIPEGPLILVLHDWGSALGFDWARRHQARVAGIAYMEAIVMPVRWADWPVAARGIFEALRSPAGEEMILQKNLFIEAILPKAILRPLTPEEHAAYRRPFTTPGEDRRPMLAWPREIPIDGTPADVHDIVAAYGAWLAKAPIAKLFINAEPGSILAGRQREFCRAWPNQSEVTVKGSHFIQEDSPEAIGTALRHWLQQLRKGHHP
ncbi:MAG: haloalkane dehalogenase [Pseudomonadota bacterium]